MATSSLTVYKASAGSGKTFTLTIQYIKNLLTSKEPSAHRHILAVTFTNKATAEMKDRIMQQLYGIWKGLRSSDGYLAALQNELRADGVIMTDEEVRLRSGKALCRILHDYDRFRVETIDSFFQSVLKNLAHELNLTANLKVELKNDEAVSAAVDRIMERLHLTPTVLNWILEYVEERIENNQRWDVAREVKSFGTWIFKDEYLSKEQELKETLKDNGKIAELRRMLNAEIRQTADILQSAAEHIRDTMTAHGIGFDALSRGSTLNTYLTRLEEGNYTKADFGSTLQNYVDDPLKMLRAGDRKKPDLVAAVEELSPLVDELHRFQTQYVPRCTSAALALKHLNPLRLLGVIDEEVTALNTENDSFLLAKTPILLHNLIEDNDAPFIFEKMGTLFHHVMIDEFQDTSSMQWKNFKVLLMENAASGFGNLLVGDVKQSIYRWRNGDWTILDQIDKEMAAQRPDIRPLPTNHRSERRIITFNNALFKAAATALDRIPAEETDTLTHAYADVEQRCPEGKAESGFVSLRFYNRNDKETDWETDMLDELCARVEELHTGGLPYDKMAILVRRRSSIPPIIQHFATQLPDVKLVSDEAFLLSASRTVNILIAAMRCLNDAEDRISEAYLVLHAAHTEADPSVHDLLNKDLGAQLPETFTAQKDKLRAMPLYELQEELYRIFRLDRIPGEDAYLFAYFDRLNAYLQEHPSDIASFLTYWDETLYKEAIPSGEVDGIRIFTIHKSKGLQFHTVFMPYCDWAIEKDSVGFGRSSDLLWCTPKEEPFNILPTIPITPCVQMRDSIFAEEYEEEHLQRRVDNLNTLYVAFTRAEKNLYAWCRTNGTAKEPATVGDLIYVSLPEMAGIEADTEEDDAGFVGSYAYGTPVTRCDTQKRESDNRMQTDGRQQSIAVGMHSYKARIEFCQSNRAEEFMEQMAAPDTGDAKGSGERRRMGIMMHKLFSTIYTQADVEKALRGLETEGLIGTREERDTLKQQVEQAFTLPQVRHWFDGTMKLYNECPILTRDYNTATGKYEIYRPDRVMFGSDRIIVVDFKFGNRRNEYHTQVSGYMKQLRLMEPDKEVKGYLWYILNREIEEVEG